MIAFDILTLFPNLCAGAFSESVLKKAQENRLIQIRCLNIRDWTTDKHHVTDEPPYGGGPGMVMKPEPIFAAVESIRTERSHVILIGDYILSNGAVAAAVVVDAVARLIPGVLGDSASAVDESFSSGLLEYPQYTRPQLFRGWSVPEILLSGHHRAIREWREHQAQRKTRERRPDL